MNNIYKTTDNDKLNIATLVTFTRAEHEIHKKEIQTIKESGLTTCQFGVLEALYNKGDLKICDIIERMLTTSGNITVVIKNLELNGLVKKSPDLEDKRVSIISITEKGRKVIQDMYPGHVENISRIFNVLTEEEKKSLNHILRKFKNI